MDFILNGQASGDVASRLLMADMDPRCLRPYIGDDNRSYITANVHGKSKAVLSNTTATLRKDDWKILDDAIIKVAKPRLKLVADLRSAGLTFTIPNGMGKTVLDTETMSDIGPASVSLDPTRENANDRPEFEPTSLPLPVIHKDFHYTARQIMASRNGGSPLDTVTAELAGRRVAEEAEKLAIGVSTDRDQFTFGGGTIYGITDFPSRVGKTITSPAAAGWSGSTFLTEVMAMMQLSRAKYHFGPWVLYVASAWDQYLDDDFKAASDKTIRNRVKELEGLTDIRTLDYFTGTYDMVLVQMTTDVIREVLGMEITTIEWDTIGGLRKNFKVMAIMVPQLRADQENQTGIVHGTTV